MKTATTLGILAAAGLALVGLTGCPSGTDPIPKGPAAWSIVGQAGFSDYKPIAMDLAVAPNGSPYVAFLDMGSYYQFRSRVMRYSGSAWADLVPPPLGSTWTPGLSHDRADSYSLAFDSAGTAYVAYYAYSEDTSPIAFYVYKHSGSTWSQLGSVGVGPALLSSLALRIGAGDTPYLAVNSDDGNGSGFLQSLSYDGASWNALRSPRLDYSGEASAAALDPSFKPYFAYANTDTPTDLHVASGDSSAWSAVGGTLPPALTGNLSPTPLAFSQSGVPYIAFANYDDQYLSVMKYADSAWTSVGPAKITSIGVDNVCLKLDPSGTPYVLYRTFDWVGGADNKAYLMKYDGTDWIYVGGTAVSPGYCDSLSLAFNSAGDPYVAFLDQTKGDKATVMTYQ